MLWAALENTHSNTFEVPEVEMLNGVFVKSTCDSNVSNREDLES